MIMIMKEKDLIKPNFLLNLQINIQNETHEIIQKKTKTLEKSDKYKSWIWKWCDPIEFENGTVGGECRVKLTDEKICGKTYLSGNSTSNLITHLAGAHQITEDTNIEGRLVSLILF